MGLQLKLVMLKNAVPIALEELNNAHMDTFLEAVADSLLNPPIVKLLALPAESAGWQMPTSPRRSGMRRSTHPQLCVTVI